MKKYTVLEDGERYTIGQYDEGYKAYILNDGICQYYWWDTEKEARLAAAAYNAYDGMEWLGEHGFGNDTIDADEADDLDAEMVDLYRLFHAVE